MARLLEKYRDDLVPALMERLGLKNPLAVPRLSKIVVSMGVGSAVDNADHLEAAAADLTTITGQKPKVCPAKVSVSGFKLREGMPIGLQVTLRGARMYEFLDRLISITLPRVRDFRGLNPGAFDGRGNYSLGLGDQSVFPEVNLDDIAFSQGMNVTIVITGSTDEGSFELLKGFGMPFRAA